MYQQIAWEMFAAPLGYMEHTLGTTIPGCLTFTNIDKSIIISGEFDVSSYESEESTQALSGTRHKDHELRTSRTPAFRLPSCHTGDSGTRAALFVKNVLVCCGA
jgi:hypothetical protein